MNKPIRPLALPDSAPCSGLEVVTLAADGSTAPLRMLQRFAIDAHAALCDHARGVSDESTLLRIQSAWINTVGIESTDQLAEVLKAHPGALDPDAGLLGLVSETVKGKGGVVGTVVAAPTAEEMSMDAETLRAGVDAMRQGDKR